MWPLRIPGMWTYDGLPDTMDVPRHGRRVDATRKQTIATKQAKQQAARSRKANRAKK